MKKLFYGGIIILAFSAFTPFSLPKHSIKFKFTASHVKIYEDIARLQYGHLRALAFGVLSPEEKRAIWEYKFSNYFNKFKQNPEKLEFIKKVYIEFSNYSYEPSEIHKFRAYANENWRRVYTEAIQVFGSQLEAFNMLFQIVPMKLEEMPQIGDEPKTKPLLIYPDCECIKGQPGGCFYTNPNGTVVFGTCLSYSCTQDPAGGGCGFFGTTPCDGYGCDFL